VYRQGRGRRSGGAEHGDGEYGCNQGFHSKIPLKELQLLRPSKHP
jgi:hypothetical protein